MHHWINLYNLWSSIGSMLGFLIMSKRRKAFSGARAYKGGVLIITHHVASSQATAEATKSEAKKNLAGLAAVAALKNVKTSKQ
jgi:hypothetical protein